MSDVPVVPATDVEVGFVDISEEKNCGLLKKILVEGSGDEAPPKGSKVKVHYVGTLHSDGSKFDSSRDRPGFFEFEVGVGRVIKGWDVGICTMKKGEKAILRCSSDFAYGDDGSPPKIPGGATLNFEVELFSWKEKVKEPYEMSTEERSQFATKQKELGNAAVASQDWAAAVEAYQEGIRYITSSSAGSGHGHGESDDEESEDDGDGEGGTAADLNDADKALAAALCSNCAAMHLKLNEPQLADKDCAKALLYDGANVKAIFRRAQAQLALGNFAACTENAKKVLELDKDNKQAEQLIRTSAAEEKKAKKREKDLYSKMFG